MRSPPHWPTCCADLRIAARHPTRLREQAGFFIARRGSRGMRSTGSRPECFAQFLRKSIDAAPKPACRRK
jgi:hypothetical protein